MRRKKAEPGSPDSKRGRQGRDVLIIGGGVAGLATAVAAARRGLAVTVVSDESRPSPTVGESLEFSAPSYLRELGIEPDALIEAGIAHPKTNVHVTLDDGKDFEIWPPGWFHRFPFFAGNEALHINRVRFDAHLRALATAAGVVFVNDLIRDVNVDVNRQVIRSVSTPAGQTFTATWFVDASGRSARVLPRSLGLNRTFVGPSRLAFHRREQVEEAPEVTTLGFSSNRDDHLTWHWAIPIGPKQVSYGTSGVSHGGSPLTRADGDGAEAYRCFHHDQCSGPNWLLVGDVAGLVDPVSSNGVACALRGALSAARLLTKEPTKATARDHQDHHHSVLEMVRTVNQVTRRVLHHRGLRRRIGLRLAIFVFAGITLVCNGWYVRLQPRSGWRLALHRKVLALARFIGSVCAPSLAFTSETDDRGPVIDLRTPAATGIEVSAGADQ